MESASKITESESLTFDINKGPEDPQSRLVYVTKINLNDSAFNTEQKEVMAELLKGDIIENPLYSLKDISSKLNSIKKNWTELNLFQKDSIKFEVDLDTTNVNFDKQLDSVYTNFLKKSDDDILNYRELFDNYKPIPVELKVTSKMIGINNVQWGLSSHASNTEKFSYQFKTNGLFVPKSTNFILNYNTIMKTGVIPAYKPTFSINTNLKHFFLPYHNFYLNTNLNLYDKMNTLDSYKIGMNKELNKNNKINFDFISNQKASIFTIGYLTTMNNFTTLNINWNYDVFKKTSEFVNTLNTSSIKSPSVSDNLQLQVKSSDSCKASYNITTGSKFFAKVGMEGTSKISKFDPSIVVDLAVGFNPVKKTSGFEVGYKFGPSSEMSKDNVYYGFRWEA
ncbi:uncharacterized protein HGUI_02042 [Hanseniaspora guilliermondii]|uniref:Uncharacterized protein n=1 Tax=Hanseniaspora guilliermondii TaxID=56406 RepID=A0A1L0B0B2_9ASCO|nr:uncharacterized protein HGUI_02042 [Hanseniaspora guilliermondii]